MKEGNQEQRETQNQKNTVENIEGEEDMEWKEDIIRPVWDCVTRLTRV